MELGCGVGTASLCLMVRVPGLRLTGLEIQADHADLARKNALMNNQDMEVITGDLSKMSPELRQQSFDHVLINPPYFDRRMGNASPNSARETAMGEDTPLATWIVAATRRLKPKGFLTLIHRAERLQDILSAMPHSMGSMQILPLHPRVNRDSHLVIMRARKEGRALLRLHAPIALHEGDNHPEDKEHYTPSIRRVLREAAPLFFPG